MGHKENEQEKDTQNYKIWIPLIFAIAGMIGLIGGYKMAGEDVLKSMFVELDGNESGQPGRVEELVRFIESRYVDEVDNEELIEDAFQNIISHLDPHSIYLRPEEMGLLNEQMGGSFEGIGIESILLDDTLHVNHVLSGGPAEKAGLKIGDQIIAINDSITAGRALEFAEIRKMLKGEKQSEIKLTIKMFSDGQVKDIMVTIDDVDIKSAKGFRYNDELAVVSVNRFSSDTYIEFMKVLEQIEKDGGFSSLIIDLRGNPGGFLPEATKILNQIFKEKGKLLVFTQGRNERVSEYKSTGKNFYDIDKVAILVDEGSASGSEIIAGAIQDWDRGIVVGRRTFGKGLVQEQYELSNGGALRLTVAEYFTPSGRLIQKSYEDKDAYRDDISSRIASGELAGNSAMPINDSTVYKTKIKKRVVYGGGGISPDIYIPTDSLLLSKYNLIAKSQVAAFVFSKFKNNKLNIELDESAFVQDWKVSEQMISDFRGYLDFVEPQHSWIDPYLRKHLKVEIGKLLYGNRIAMEVEMRDDEFVNESIQALSKQNIFAELK